MKIDKPYKPRFRGRAKSSRSAGGSAADEECDEDPAEEAQETPDEEAAEEAQEPPDPTARARGAVKAKLAAIAKRDGKGKY